MYKESFYSIPQVIDGTHYIYNSLTKSFLQDVNGNLETFIKEIVEGLNNGKIALTDEISQLISNGFICKADVDERKVIDFLYKKNFFDSSRLNLILVPTMECNFSCPYCFELPHRQMKTAASYFETLDRYAKTTFLNYNHIEVSLFGGEPLLNIEKFLIFLSTTKKLSIEHKFTYRTSITTNGSLLTLDILENLASHNCAMLQITLDGDQKSHDDTRKHKDGRPSFYLLIDKINNLLADYLNAGMINFILRINLSNNSVDEMEIALKHIDENLRKFIKIFFRPIYNTETYNKLNTNTVFDLRGYYDLANKLGFHLMKNFYFYRSCEGCGDENFIYLMPDLSLWKCINTLSCHEPEIGRILEDGNVKLDANRLVNWYLSADCFDDPKCRDCKLLPDCYGGCILYHAVHGERLCSPFELVSLPFLYEQE